MRLRLLRLSCFLLFIFVASSLYADVGLILAEATPLGMSRWTNAGHAAVYLSRVCPATPIKLRLCEADENGAVISNYIRFDEDQPYEWNVVPLDIFLYGVEDEVRRPLYGSAELRKTLQERFREKYLSEVCTGPCATNPDAHWRDLVAESFARGMYIFVVKTTLAQDLRLMAEFNSAPNVNRYNGFTNNCADFSARVLNFYFPHAAKPDHINDFGMTSPKAIAKSFSHFAQRHSELEYRVIRIPQMPGTFPRSTDCRKGTEVAFRSRKWLFPLLLKSPHELVLFATSYMLTGRFNPSHEFRDHAAVELASSEQWREYRSDFQRMRAMDGQEKIESLRKIARNLDEHGHLSIDNDGSAWVQIPYNGAQLRIGVSRDTILDSGSDPELAYRIMLARVHLQLQKPRQDRESLSAFIRDWNLLKASRESLEKAKTNAAAVIVDPELQGGGQLP